MRKISGKTLGNLAVIFVIVCAVLIWMGAKGLFVKDRSAIMGVGASKRLSNVNWGVVKDLVFTWICTFPGCGLLGFLMAKLFLVLFV